MAFTALGEKSLNYGNRHRSGSIHRSCYLNITGSSIYLTLSQVITSLCLSVLMGKTRADGTGV